MRQPQSVNSSKKPIYAASQTELPRTAYYLVYIMTGLNLCASVLYLIVGIIYLSIYFYAYSFIQFSTTVVAGLFIAWAVLLAIIVAANVFFIWAKRPEVVLLTTIAALVLFIVLVAIGIWGLAVSVGAGIYGTVSIIYYCSLN